MKETTEKVKKVHKTRKKVEKEPEIEQHPWNPGFGWTDSAHLVFNLRNRDSCYLFCRGDEKNRV